MKRTLREIIREMLEELLEEGYGRAEYIANVGDVLRGALRKYYQALYAELNSCATPQDIAHWRKESNSLLDTEFVRKIEGSERGFKRQPAFEAALLELRSQTPHILRDARNQIVKKCGVDPKLVVDPTDDDTDEFFAKVENIFAERFP